MRGKKMDNNSNCISENWNTIINEYDKLLIRNSIIEKYNKNLNKGATDEQIKMAEQILGFPFPSELAQLFKCNNGNAINSKENVYLGAILGLQFIPLDVLIRTWSEWCEFTDEKGLDAYCTSIYNGQIKCLYANKRWIPFASDGWGNHIGIDLDPDVNGTVGQVVNFGSDENNKLVFAKNLNSFLELMIDIIKSSDFKLVKKTGEDAQFSLGNGDKGIHAIDYLKKKLSNN